MSQFAGLRGMYTQFIVCTMLTLATAATAATAANPQMLGSHVRKVDKGTMGTFVSDQPLSWVAFGIELGLGVLLVVVIIRVCVLRKRYAASRAGGHAPPSKRSHKRRHGHRHSATNRRSGYHGHSKRIENPLSKMTTPGSAWESTVSSGAVPGLAPTSMSTPTPTPTVKTHTGSSHDVSSTVACGQFVGTLKRGTDVFRHATQPVAPVSVSTLQARMSTSGRSGSRQPSVVTMQTCASDVSQGAVSSSTQRSTHGVVVSSAHTLEPNGGGFNGERAPPTTHFRSRGSTLNPHLVSVVVEGADAAPYSDHDNEGGEGGAGAGGSEDLCHGFGQHHQPPTRQRRGHRHRHHQHHHRQRQATHKQRANAQESDNAHDSRFGSRRESKRGATRAHTGNTSRGRDFNSGSEDYSFSDSGSDSNNERDGDNDSDSDTGSGSFCGSGSSGGSGSDNKSESGSGSGSDSDRDRSEPNVRDFESVSVASRGKVAPNQRGVKRDSRLQLASSGARWSVVCAWNACLEYLDVGLRWIGVITHPTLHLRKRGPK